MSLLDPSQINYELIEMLIHHIHTSQKQEKDDSRAILVFLPGVVRIVYMIIIIAIPIVMSQKIHS